MKMFVEPQQIYLHREPVDFRKSINGLALIVEQQLELSPFSEALFLFSNRQRNKLKILYWDKTGFALWYKRLEKQRFKWPNQSNESCLELDEQQLHWLLGGYDVVGHAPLHYRAVGL